MRYDTDRATISTFCCKFPPAMNEGNNPTCPPGTATLLEELDKKLMVLLRDGRTLIGYLRSVDQFANLVLHRTIERIHVGKEYGDIDRGVFIVRGENVVLLGEIDPDKEAQLPLKEVSVEDILAAQRREQEAKVLKEKIVSTALKDRGLNMSSELTTDEF
ncbi:U6 snRNA-associated Sm-like protein LSm1 [Neocloeon triangulifer]|uniref:U6 snRNA-associated Sm-like protein LSm1 n=1 Tax=Neocloeon triangulifer TaxID=2078957 RepID=UPI00286F7936|nr:U6 snRNA-associated Sm-like protein LSm1 [Neocloeon triangulifer]